MFNPDGSEDFCGNGLRCAARYAADHGWVGNEFAIHHFGRRVQVSVSGERVSTTLGVATFNPRDIPLARDSELFEGELSVGGEKLTVSSLSTGSAHTVIFVDALPDDERFFALSPLIETHELFPERTSVIWAQQVSPMALRLRIWERAVGETLGCGSGSSAAAAVLVRKLGRGGEVTVENPGGTVQVSMGDWRSPITISGKAREVYVGEWELGAFGAALGVGIAQ
jgi:diaminopimelate epimerase